MISNNFKLLNRLVGWAVFAIAAMVYLLTIEPSASLWDCGEFIATSYKLEVGHPPGAPLYMLLARIATIFAPSTHYVPHMVNGMNALASAFCILFLFWTITHIGRRLFERNGKQMVGGNMIAVLGAGAVGALAYTFTDTFWFSAVEGEVYALSSMFTALVVWLMLCWEEEADEPHSMRWIVLISYLMGLSIGVHILNLLTIPALVFIYYFRKVKRVTILGLILMMFLAGALLYVVNGIIIPYTVHVGMLVDVFFVNTLSLPVNSGMIVFAVTVFALLGAAIVLTHRFKLRIANLIVVSLTMILLGFSSYATMTIRAAVNPPMNSNNPDNPAALLSVLNRDQYGNKPLLYGPSYAAPADDYKFRTVRDYDPETGKYNEHKVLDDYTYPSQFMTFFPRMWNAAKSAEDYKHWAAGDEYENKVVKDKNGKTVRDANGKPLYKKERKYGKEVSYEDRDGKTRKVTVPTAIENLRFFVNYQLGHMYWRYFLWNFVGRQDDIQPSTSTALNGNWLSGIKPIDEARLGPQDNLPREVGGNASRNTYFFLPFLLGVIGLLYQLARDQRNFVVVMWLFVMMGIALVVYFNTSPGEPRERDYVYAGSFYAFSMWIGLGVMALYELLSKLLPRASKVAATTATVLCLGVPAILCAQNWDDHDRSHRTFARDIGYNYLMSIVEKKGVSPIIINYGDNDTFPLWFNQEVDGVRTDVRIMNSSYLDGEWYVDEMKCKANDADGIPFSLPSSKYSYKNDAIYIYDVVNGAVADAKQVMEFIRSNKKDTQMDFGGDMGMSDFVPAVNISLPVDKEAAIASGIVAEKDRDLIVDEVIIKLSGNYLSRSELMLLDLLAHFDWKRPIYFTQVYVLQKFGLLDYLQFDGYAYRLVPILTEYQSAREIGRIDADYAYDKLMNVMRFGNLNREDVHVDYFTQYNLMASRMREAFARVAKQYIIDAHAEGVTEERKTECLKRAEALLNRGLEVLPTNKIRFTEANTVPFIEAYYALELYKEGDKLMHDYGTNLMEYIDYYSRFDGELATQAAPEHASKLEEMAELLKLATKYGLANAPDLIKWRNRFAEECYSSRLATIASEELCDNTIVSMTCNCLSFAYNCPSDEVAVRVGCITSLYELAKKYDCDHLLNIVFEGYNPEVAPDKINEWADGGVNNVANFYLSLLYSNNRDWQSTGYYGLYDLYDLAVANNRLQMAMTIKSKLNKWANSDNETK